MYIYIYIHMGGSICIYTVCFFFLKVPAYLRLSFVVLALLLARSLVCFLACLFSCLVDCLLALLACLACLPCLLARSLGRIYCLCLCQLFVFACDYLLLMSSCLFNLFTCFVYVLLLVSHTPKEGYGECGLSLHKPLNMALFRAYPWLFLGLSWHTPHPFWSP